MSVVDRNGVKLVPGHLCDIYDGEEVILTTMLLHADTKCLLFTTYGSIYLSPNNIVQLSEKEAFRRRLQDNSIMCMVK